MTVPRYKCSEVLGVLSHELCTHNRKEVETIKEWRAGRKAERQEGRKKKQEGTKEEKEMDRKDFKILE